MRVATRLRFMLALLQFYIPAHGLVARCRYAEAKIRMKDYFRCFPGERAQPEANILMGLICLRLEEYQESAGYTIVAFNQLDGNTWNYTEADKAYLKLYCSNL